MQLQPPPIPPSPDLWGTLTTILIVIITGLISVGYRVLREEKVKILWLSVEYGSCLLVGYLFYEAYPFLKPSLHKAITMNIFVSSGAYLGLRVFHLVESSILEASEHKQLKIPK